MSIDQGAFDLSGRPSRLQLRELNGFDEQSVSGLDTATAIGLLDRLLVRAPGSSAQQLKAVELTAAERDRLLAAVYKRTFGSRIESTVRCTACESLFDLAFSIEDLLAALNSAALSAMPARKRTALFVWGIVCVFVCQPVKMSWPWLVYPPPRPNWNCCGAALSNRKNQSRLIRCRKQWKKSLQFWTSIWMRGARSVAANNWSISIFSFTCCARFSSNAVRFRERFIVWPSLMAGA